MGGTAHRKPVLRSSRPSPPVQFLVELEMCLPLDPEVYLVGVCLRETLTHTGGGYGTIHPSVVTVGRGRG